jgi:hypothetical protein
MPAKGVNKRYISNIFTKVKEKQLRVVHLCRPKVTVKRVWFEGDYAIHITIEADPCRVGREYDKRIVFEQCVILSPVILSRHHLDDYHGWSYNS